MRINWNLIAGICLLIAIALRIALQIHPNIVLCWLFWGLFILGSIAAVLGGRYWYSLVAVGAILNAIAMLMNNGYMPVKGADSATSIWVPLTPDSNVQQLCDIYWHMSIGDFFVFSGILLAVIYKLWNYLSETPVTTVPHMSAEGEG